MRGTRDIQHTNSHRQKDRETYKETERQGDIQRDGETETYRQTERQRDRETEEQKRTFVPHRSGPAPRCSRRRRRSCQSSQRIHTRRGQAVR